VFRFPENLRDTVVFIEPLAEILEPLLFMSLEDVLVPQLVSGDGDALMPVRVLVYRREYEPDVHGAACLTPGLSSD
jgi:hypothetical protein